MTERRTQLDTFMVSLICDNCRQEMKLGDGVYPTQPPTFQYTCNQCDKIVWSQERYPRIEYKEAGPVP